MRGSIDGLGTAHPLGRRLPSVFADDELSQRFTAGLDEVLAPLLNVLDCQDTYFSPALAPGDFVSWLGEWVGVETAPGGEDGTRETLSRLRESVAAAAHLHRLRGTARGLTEAVRLAFGIEPEITESGGAVWSAGPLGPFPGELRPHLRVVLRVDDPESVDLRRLTDLVEAARPAHIPCTVQVAAPKGQDT